ncbi:MAG: hypothetical protein AAF414_22985 [Pseudomonadota bacterium]
MARYRNRNRTVFGDRQSSGIGKRVVQLFVGLLVLIIVGGVVFLGLGDYQPEQQRIERTIDVDTSG